MGSSSVRKKMSRCGKADIIRANEDDEIDRHWLGGMLFLAVPLTCLKTESIVSSSRSRSGELS